MIELFDLGDSSRVYRNGSLVYYGNYEEAKLFSDAAKKIEAKRTKARRDFAILLLSIICGAMSIFVLAIVLLKLLVR